MPKIIINTKFRIGDKIYINSKVCRWTGLHPNPRTAKELPDTKFFESELEKHQIIQAKIIKSTVNGMIPSYKLETVYKNRDFKTRRVNQSESVPENQLYIKKKNAIKNMRETIKKETKNSLKKELKYLNTSLKTQTRQYKQQSKRIKEIKQKINKINYKS